MKKFNRCLSASIIAISMVISTGCATQDPESTLQIIPSLPAPFLSDKKAEELPEAQAEVIQQNEIFYVDNTVYREIAEGVASRGVLSGEFLVNSARFSSQQFRQTLLPQITPVASVDENGDAIGRLQVEQVIFDAGRFRAGKSVLSAEQSIAFADYAIQYNERVGTAIDAFLRKDRSSALAEVSNEISARYKKMQERALKRLQGGIGNKAELGLFELKQFEAVTEAARDDADAQTARAQLEGLTGRSFDQTPPELTFPGEQTAVPPVVALAIAEKKRAVSELWAEKSERLPRLTARGSVGIGTDLGLGFNDRANSFVAGVQLSQPLTWGKDYGLKATRADSRAASARMNEVKRDTAVELQALNLRISELRMQLFQVGKLLQRATARVDEFDEQFLAGAVGMVEAVGIIDTYKRIYRSKIELNYSLLSAQREKVQLLGLLGPYSQGG